MKINFFKILGLLGILARELKKIPEDGKVTITEAINLMKLICERLGLDFDQEGVAIDKDAVSGAVDALESIGSIAGGLESKDVQEADKAKEPDTSSDSKKSKKK
jgi:hypothetical protein